jgi:ABC-2 type transport system ATP-binding protein
MTATHVNGVAELPRGPQAALELETVSKWYGNVVAVNDISFRLGPGITGLLGPNGAGKSTLLHMMSGFLRPSAGKVTVLGEPAWENPGIYARVGLVPERESIYPFLTGREFVRLSARLHRLADAESAAERAIRAVNLDDAADRAAGGYSKGMKHRLKVAAALVHQPRVLLLDEPFNGADPRQRLQMMDMLKRMAAEGKTIVFSSHILEEVERLAENVLVIVAGRLAASGDFHEIRRLMTDRPHNFTVRSSNDRRLAAMLVENPAVFGVEIADGALSVRSADFAAFTQAIAPAAKSADVTLFELRPTDESLESVFSYLVRR